MTVYVVNTEMFDSGSTLGVFASRDGAKAAVRKEVDERNALNKRARYRGGPDDKYWQRRPRWVETEDGAAYVWTDDGGQTWQSPEEAHDHLAIIPFEVQP